MKFELQRPCKKLVSSYFEFVDEMRQAREKTWEGMIPKVSEASHEFVQRLLRAETTPQPGHVVETSYWAYLDGRIHKTTG